jgi:hypothetical protein
MNSFTIPPDGAEGNFPDTVIGAISWSKDLGRPNRPHLADGFSIVILGTDVAETAPDGPVFYPGYVLTPKVWDDENDPDTYRVQFSADGLKSVEGQIKASFGAVDAAKQAEIDLITTYKVVIVRRPGVSWTGGLPHAIAPARVTPPELEFQKHDGLLELPDFGLTDSFL